MLCSNFLKFGRREIGEIVRYLPDKKKQNFAWLSSYCYCVDRAKFCQGQPPTVYSECFRFHPNRFTFGGVIAERVNTAKTRLKVNPVYGWSLSSSRIIRVWIYIECPAVIASRNFDTKVYHSAVTQKTWKPSHEVAPTTLAVF